MRIFSWNVNGLRAVLRKGELQKFVAGQQPDILCVQETKARRGDVDLDQSGYDEHFNSGQRAGYAGTAIFLRRGATGLKPLNITLDLPDEIAKKYQLADDKFGDPNREGRVITAEFDDFYLVNVYTPNAKADLARLNLRAQNWDPAFLAYINFLIENKPVIFCGDLNVAASEIDLARPAANVGHAGFTDEERAGFQNVMASGLLDSFRFLHPNQKTYTWWSFRARAREHNVGWRIDYFIVDPRLRYRIARAEILPQQLGSDHCPILLELTD
ncbi:MAG: exodeoxyribonuclease III [Candidatus Nomurabacteria bacterium]|jgi:exodeoxyribonuclease-3|nr:exodeoxyribonuclease III [Candidatus Nomurabacteria bacterium]